MKRTRDGQEGLIQNASAYMRLKLSVNRDKPHWLDEDEEALVAGMGEEWDEFRQALITYKIHPTARQLEEVRREAADVHNYMEMLCDKLAHVLQTQKTRKA